MDALTFDDLSRQNNQLQCPYCPKPHSLGKVRAWLCENPQEPLERPPRRAAEG
jgi:hypothetical protein